MNPWQEPTAPAAATPPDRTGPWRFTRMLALDVALPLALYYALRAVGAGRREILYLFIGEAVVLASLGGLAGLILGAGGAWALGIAVPALPTHTPWSYVLLAEAIAAAIGLAAGVAPALRAANLDPIEALRAE